MEGFPGRILLAKNGSEDAALAGRAAVDLAKITGARLPVMHAWQAEVRRAYEVTIPVSLREWCGQKAAELLAKEVKQIEEAGCEVAEAHLVMSRAGDAILDLTEELGPVLVIAGSGAWARCGASSPVASRTVILVDDGIATGMTVRVAIEYLHQQEPEHLVLAVPLCAAGTAEALRSEVDDLVCLKTPPELWAIGYWYEDFEQVSDEEVVQLLERSRGAEAEEPKESDN